LIPLLARLSFLLFLSGAASLVYQILWIKQLSLIVGVDVYAITIAVSAFFVGLSTGAAVFGRAADATGRPLRLYAAIELLTAVCAVVATLWLARAAAPFAMLERSAGPLAFSLPFALVGIPAFLMGGTLPVLLRAVGAGDTASAGGRLYAANTAGAVAGTLGAAFVLIPAVGVTGSAIAAALVNLIAGLAAFAPERWVSSIPSTGEASPVQAPGKGPRISAAARSSSDRPVAVIAYVIAGALALGYEVVWSQVVVQLTSTRAFAFTIVLATYLIGLALGSALYARIAATRDPWIALGILIGGAGFLALALVAGLSPGVMTVQSDVEDMLRRVTGSELVAMLGRFGIAAVTVVLLPTVALGAAFPAAVKLAAGDRVGRDVGVLIACNTVGGVVGTLLVGFWLIPALGVVHTLAALAMAAAAIGVVALGRTRAAAGPRAAVYVICVGTLVLAAVTPPDHLARLLPLTRGGGEVTYYHESAGGAVAVVRQPGAHGFQRLYIQGVSNSGDSLPSLRYMRLQALLPLIIHRGEPRTALVIGFGTGITAGALSRFHGLERRVCAELLAAVVGAGQFFQGNFNAHADPGLSVRLRDGRRELLGSDQRYDLITLEPPPPTAAGVVNLYSRDFYELARRRLEPNGVVAQWWPLPTQNDEDSRALVRAFLDVFPYASLWTTELHEMLLVGSANPMDLDAGRIAARFRQSSVASALTDVGIASPEALLATWVTGREGLERYSGAARPVTDDRPSIEYGTWVRRDEFVRVLPQVLALRTPPPLTGTDDEFLNGVATQREALMQFYEAGLAAYKGDRKAWARALDAALRANPDNPYFRWVAGGTEF